MEGTRHSSGRGRYLWRAKDGGDDKYVLAQPNALLLRHRRTPPILAELVRQPVVLQSLTLLGKAHRTMEAKATEGHQRASATTTRHEIRRIRLLATLSHDEDEVGKQLRLTKRQVADIALGDVRPKQEAGSDHLDSEASATTTNSSNRNFDRYGLTIKFPTCRSATHLKWLACLLTQQREAPSLRKDPSPPCPTARFEADASPELVVVDPRPNRRGIR